MTRPIDVVDPAPGALHCQYCVSVAGGALYKCANKPLNRATAETDQPCLKTDWWRCPLNPNAEDVPFEEASCEAQLIGADAQWSYTETPEDAECNS